jgi:serine/threonine protein kinase
VAVKISHAKRMHGKKAEWFFREARAAAQLQHPNIVSVFEIGREGDQVFIVSEFVRGVTLNHWLTGRSPSPSDAAWLWVKLTDALQHAHDAGVVHRDLKPRNILVDREGQPRITDFGLAKRDSGEPTLTLEGKILGTPSYRSPEQAFGMAHHATGRSDIFSLGVILFELLTHVRPFSGSTSMVIHQVIHDDAPPVRNFNRAVPLDLEAVCLKCLEKKPEHRYASMADLEVDLGRFLAGEPVSARRVTLLNRCSRWCKRNPVVSGLACSLLVVLLCGLVSTTLLWRRAEGALAEAETSGTRLRENLYTAHLEIARQALWRGDIQQMDELLSQYLPRTPDEQDLRGFVWYHLWGRCRRFSQSLDH